MTARTLLVALITLFAAATARAQAFPEFAFHHIDNIGRSLGQTALVDLDGDGDLDWIAGEAAHADSRIWWWEYRGPDEWIRHDLGSGHTDVGGAVHDVDADGDADLLAGSILLLNTGDAGAGPSFEPYGVGTIYSHDTEFADMNGDGVLDAIANSDESGLYWYEIPPDPTRPWVAHLIASADAHEVHAGVSPRAVGDLDGDGDADVATAEGWYEQGDGWTYHAAGFLGEPHQYGIGVRTWVGDLDGDGDDDVIQTEADNPDGRVAWFENDGFGAFTRHLIQDEGEGLDLHALAVADFDLDGDVDIFSCGGPISAAGRFLNVIWENRAGSWIEHVVAEQPCHEAEAGDVDGDGDVDIVSKPWSTGDEHYFLENLAAD